jgi:lysophospholipase L1-like esterase
MTLPTRIVAIGASTIFGRQDMEGGGFVGRLKKHHELQSNDHAVFNLGISGQLTSEILVRIGTEVSIRRPDLIILGTGVNDFRRVGSASAQPAATQKEFEINSEKLIIAARGLCSVLVIGQHQIDESKMESRTKPESWIFRAEDIQTANNILRKHCEEKRVPFLDTEKLFSADDLKSVLSGDGLHLNSKGHEQVFRSILEKYSADHHK